MEWPRASYQSYGTADFLICRMRSQFFRGNCGVTSSPKTFLFAFIFLIVGWDAKPCFAALGTGGSATETLDTSGVQDSAAIITSIQSPEIISTKDSVKVAPSPAPIPPAIETSVVPEDQGPDQVIEVDHKQSQNAGKSLALALVLSATLPGTGELYLQDNGHAKAFLLAEAGFWAGFYMAFLSKESYLQSARNFASENAGIDASEKGEGFLNTMATYRSYQEKQHRQDSYELTQILSGKRDKDYDIAPIPANDWDFGSASNPQNTRNWKDFQSTLRFYRSSKVVISFAIGAMALNRLASVVNTLHVFKSTSTRGLSLNIVPEFGQQYAATHVLIGF